MEGDLALRAGEELTLVGHHADVAAFRDVGGEELGRSAEAWMQRIETMRARYVEGIRDLDARTHAHYSADFLSLTPERQDAVLRAVEASGTGKPTTLTPNDALAGPVSAIPIEPERAAFSDVEERAPATRS